MCSGAEAGSYLRFIDFSKLESNKEEEDLQGMALLLGRVPAAGLVIKAHGLVYHSTLGSRVIKKKKMFLRPSQKVLTTFSTNGAV